ncbi:NCA2-domain-containing protein [Sistotremastrum suecicum HHB10207 ss-3]|uniref:NCA2-domain-containing protein n=1 Tax=Sistotremastrum suecicum HHB10207 ss-3 TaxID=1314776 RepID=A0A165ZSL0_9AGAM|nr:NCA2-domain-containing protein [Sistotremastrum suecicum HHB10207 ss-3]
MSLSSFTLNHTRPLLSRSPVSFDDEAVPTGEALPKYDKWRTVLVNLTNSLETKNVHSAIHTLDDVEPHESFTQNGDVQLDSLQLAVAKRVLVGIYAEAMEECLKQARELDDEVNWWSDIERSSLRTAGYLVQTFPIRIHRLVLKTIDVLRERNLPLQLRYFTPSSIRNLLSAPGTLNPSALSTTLFPHLKSQHHNLFTSPLELAWQECRFKRQELEKTRNSRAEMLGELTTIRGALYEAIGPSGPEAEKSLRGFASKVASITTKGESILTVEDTHHALPEVWNLAFQSLPFSRSQHSATLSEFGRPSFLTRTWPRILLGPPIALLMFRMIYNSRDSIFETLKNAQETVEGFWTGYVMSPIREILDTVRSGGGDGPRIISQDGMKADMESLERMALSLSAEKLNYSSEQLEELSKQIKLGDLTPVLKLYEDDIKSPIKNVIAGSLVRTLLIQVQKVKVDVDLAMSGIDKLLKSQELTFAFVGVAPSLAILYAASSWLRSLWSGGRDGGKIGGKRARSLVWNSMRRVERLLNAPQYIDGKNSDMADHETLLATSKASENDVLPPLTNGLIILSVSTLRSYAEKSLPKRSRLRDGFLEDICDLEDPSLTRAEKRRVIERMWRCWSVPLGWDRFAVA